MKNIWKKIATIATTVMLSVGAMFTLSACKEPSDVDESQIMNLSVNPSIEFVLDNDDEVLSVTASNEDGALVLEQFADWVGMDADEAALKFLEIAEEKGFVVSGETDGQTFTISVSGVEAQDLYDDVKEKVNAKATEFGLAVGNMVKIEKEALEARVAEMYQDYTSAQIDAMNEEKLIELVKTSMNETKDLLTDDEKQAYYRERAQKVLETKMEAVDSYLEEHSAGLEGVLNSGLRALVTVMNGYYDTLKNTVFPAINAQIDALYDAASTGINAVRENYLDAKQTYLDAVESYRAVLESSANPDTDPLVISAKQAMESAKQAADTIKTNLETARESAKSTLMTKLEDEVHGQIVLINEKLDAIIASIASLKTQMQADVDAAIVALKTEYANNATDPWGTVAE